MLLALALSIAALPRPARGDPPALPLSGELRDGDDRCTNLCDRYGFVWEAGTEVEIRLVTDGFAGYLNVDGPGVHEVSEDPGNEARLVFVVPRAAPYSLIVNAYNYYDRGAYRLAVTPQPTRYLVPAVRPQTPPLALEVSESDDAVLRTADALTAGYRPSGREVRAELDRIPALRFAARRGRCYRAVVMLDPGARWTRLGPATTAASTIVRMRVRSTRESLARTQTARSTARVVALDDELCPSANGTLEITFDDRTRGTPVTAAGAGSFVARVFERTASSSGRPGGSSPQASLAARRAH